MDTLTLDTNRFLPRSADMSKNSLTKNWGDDASREYFLALSRGLEFRLASVDYPEEFSLSQGWHKTLDGMRQYSSTHNSERYAGIGFKDARDTIILPVNPGHGRQGTVLYNEVVAHESRMIREGRVTGFIGDIHSHPRNDEATRPLDKLADLSQAGFSVGDLYRFLYNNDRPVNAIVDGPLNIFVFKTKDSKTTKAPDYPTFAEAWYRRNDWKYGGTTSTGEHASPVNKTAPSIWELNKRIAKEYGLALYRGEAGKPLKRIYPEIPTPKHRLLSRINPFASAKK